MSFIVSFHRLTNYNYISFSHVPGLWAQPKIPVKFPCGLFPRSFLVRSLFWGRAPGFYSLSHYQSATQGTPSPVSLPNQAGCRGGPTPIDEKVQKRLLSLPLCLQKIQFYWGKKSHCILYNLEVGVKIENYCLGGEIMRLKQQQCD